MLSPINKKKKKKSAKRQKYQNTHSRGGNYEHGANYTIAPPPFSNFKTLETPHYTDSRRDQ